MNDDELDTLLKAAEKLAPTGSKRKKCRPYTPDFITAVKHKLNLDLPLDAAVFACLVTCFYAAARLGEFTVRRLDAFDPALHITPANLTNTSNREGNEVTVLHVPRTKTNVQGEDVYWAKQDGETDPVAALQHHRFCKRTIPMPNSN
jgi:hypothetical protein